MLILYNTGSIAILTRVLLFYHSTGSVSLIRGARRHRNGGALKFDNDSPQTTTKPPPSNQNLSRAIDGMLREMANIHDPATSPTSQGDKPGKLLTHLENSREQTESTDFFGNLDRFNIPDGWAKINSGHSSLAPNKVSSPSDLTTINSSLMLASPINIRERRRRKKIRQQQGHLKYYSESPTPGRLDNYSLAAFTTISGPTSDATTRILEIFSEISPATRLASTTTANIYSKVKAIWNDFMMDRLLEITTTEANNIELKELLIQFNQVFNRRSKKYAFKKSYRAPAFPDTGRGGDKLTTISGGESLQNANESYTVDYGESFGVRKSTPLITSEILATHSWTKWSPCSADCGEGYKFRKMCRKSERNVKGCKAKLQQLKLCVTESCFNNFSIRYQLVEGNKAIMSCPMKLPKVSFRIVRWYRGDNLLTPMEDSKYRGHKNSLIIDPLSRNDSGAYHCVGLNTKTGDKMTADITLSVIDCTVKYCINGLCVEIPVQNHRSFRCICLPGYVGDFCDKVEPIHYGPWLIFVLLGTFLFILCFLLIFWVFMENGNGNYDYRRRSKGSRGDYFAVPDIEIYEEETILSYHPGRGFVTQFPPPKYPATKTQKNDNFGINKSTNSRLKVTGDMDKDYGGKGKPSPELPRFIYDFSDEDEVTVKSIHSVILRDDGSRDREDQIEIFFNPDDFSSQVRTHTRGTAPSSGESTSTGRKKKRTRSGGNISAEAAAAQAKVSKEGSRTGDPGNEYRDSSKYDGEDVRVNKAKLRDIVIEMYEQSMGMVKDLEDK